jgi:hypothetical protein
MQVGDFDASAALFAVDGVLVTPFGIFRGPEESRDYSAGFLKSSRA